PVRRSPSPPTVDAPASRRPCGTGDRSACRRHPAWSLVLAYASRVLPLQQQDTGRGPASGGDDGGLGVLHLALAGLVAQLGHCLVEKAEPVAPTFRELPTVRIDRELAVQRDATTTVEPVVGLAEAAES